MINSSSENTMRIGSLCLPPQTSLLNSGCIPGVTLGRCNKAESSAVNDVDVKTSRGQAREVTQHYNCLSLCSSV